MIVAFDTKQQKGVAGPPLHCDSEDREQHGRYECIACGEPLTYQSDGPETFVHEGASCVKTGNMSDQHRIAEELVGKELLNCLSLPSCTLELETRVGSAPNFVIADVCVREPLKLAVEVIHSNTSIPDPRRLQAYADAGYAVTYVAVEDTQESAPTIDASVDIGRCNLTTYNVTWGSIINPRESTVVQQTRVRSSLSA